MKRITKIKVPYSSDAGQDTAMFDDAFVWCKNKFGNPVYPITGDHGWAVVRPSVFSFINEEDAVLFALRWA